MNRDRLRFGTRGLAALVFAVIALATLAVTPGCGHRHRHGSPPPASLLVENRSGFFAIFSIDDCATYSSHWLAPGESAWIEVSRPVDHGHLPGTIYPGFFFESFDGSVRGHAAYGPVWIEPAGVYTFTFF